MLPLVALTLALSAGVICDEPKGKSPQAPQRLSAPPHPQLLYYGGLQNNPQLQNYEVPLLEHQQHIFPRLQPQLFFYNGGAPPGQQFLLHPGNPPGNFLVPQPQPQPHPHPQPQPGVILRDNPQRPVFVAGYPKPSHIPPIEKDAEEIPTDPARIPKFPSTPNRKPEKIETFGESGKDERTIEEQEPLPSAAAEKVPEGLLKKSFANLKPGQRFFILNGQPLFSNYPQQLQFEGVQNLVPNGRYSQELLPQTEQLPVFNRQNPAQDLFLRNSVTGQITDVNNQFAQQPEPIQNFVSLNQPQEYLRDSVPFPIYQQFNKEPVNLGNHQVKLGQGTVGFENIPDYSFLDQNNPTFPYNYYQYGITRENLENDDTVVIEPKAQAQKSKESESEALPEPHQEPSISQAQPGAIALAGPGGVASADPRGTALVGKGGLAVSSPQATAVAGPSKDRETDKKRKVTRKEKQ